MSKKKKDTFIIKVYNEEKDKFKTIIHVKYIHEDISDEDKMSVFKTLAHWVDQQLNELHPEQE